MEIEQKALALVNEVRVEAKRPPFDESLCGETFTALCRAIEQHEAFRQEVSDAVENNLTAFAEGTDWTPEKRAAYEALAALIVAKPDTDPLVEVLADMGLKPKGGYDWASEFRNTLAQRGGKIVWGEE